MSPEHIKLVDLITSQDLTAAADSGDFPAIAAALNAATVERRAPTPISMAETLGALESSADATIAAFEATPTGRAGLAKLAATGLDFGHPLVVAQLDAMVAAAAITQATADILAALSVATISPAAAVGIESPPLAAEISAAWSAKQLRETIHQVVVNLDALYNEWLNGDETALVKINAAATILETA